MYERPLFIVGLTALLAGLMACGDDATESASPATPDMAMADMAEPDAAVPSEELRAAFTHKMVKRSGEGPFPTLAYECPQCTFEQWASIEAPEGWSKGPAQIALFEPGNGIGYGKSFIAGTAGPANEEGVAIRRAPLWRLLCRTLKAVCAMLT